MIDPFLQELSTMAMTPSASNIVDKTSQLLGQLSNITDTGMATIAPPPTPQPLNNG